MTITQYSITREAVQVYLDNNWQPVPVPAGSKGPVTAGWQNGGFSINDFREGDNIGILFNGSGLVDVDLDSEEARIAAETFLPPTAMISGRKGNPRSHYWYKNTEIQDRVAYEDLAPAKGKKGEMLVEIRAGKNQTVVPPSIHPSGERLEWYQDGDPGKASGQEIQQAVGLVAGVALLAKHWPEQGAGGRHAAAMALSGFLANNGIEESVILDIIDVISDIVRDDDPADRRQTVSYSVEKASRGEAIQGGPTLAELLGSAVVDRFSKFVGIQVKRPSNVQATLGYMQNDNTRQGNSTSDFVITLVLESGAEMFHTGEAIAYARIPRKGHVEVAALRSTRFKDWMIAKYHTATGRGLSRQIIEDVINTLYAIAMNDGQEEEVHVKVARQGDRIYIDLVNKDWQVVEITAEGWQVIDQSPVNFKRDNNMQPLATPVHGGSMEELRSFINIGNEKDLILTQGWLVGALNPTGAYPLLIISGQPGAAKSTTAKILRQLIDPNKAPLRVGDPKEMHDLSIQANNSWVMVLDNLSHIPTWLSNALCTFSTGGGFSTRKKYSDDEETILDARRPIILTGIEELATRSDLLDRSILLYPKRIEGTQTEKALLASFEAVKPRVLGALFDGVVSALRNEATTHIQNNVRMADFSVWVTAAEEGLKMEKGTFMNTYRENRSGANELALEAQPVAQAILRLLERNVQFKGTYKELLDSLTNITPERDFRTWPKNGIAMKNKLTLISPNLKEVGILVTKIEGRTSKGMLVEITQKDVDQKENNVVHSTSYTQPNSSSQRPW